MDDENTFILEDDSLFNYVKDEYNKSFLNNPPGLFKKMFPKFFKDEALSLWTDFRQSEQIANSILSKALSAHEILPRKGKSGKIAFLYIERRLTLSNTYLMEGRDFYNIFSMSLYHKFSPLTQKILYSYCQTNNGLHIYHEHDPNNKNKSGFVDTRNTVTYKGRKFKLSYETINIAPDCDDIFIEIEAI